uniref:ALMS motif domain-containing protein n=1 Tax=Mola mola TaxID=94237 RepID=A0A3Q3W8I9_MOLML
KQCPLGYKLHNRNKQKDPKRCFQNKFETNLTQHRINLYELYCIHSADRLLTVNLTPPLQEALELFRPDFISRSQGRVMQLEQRAVRRRALRDTKPDLVQGHREDCCKQKRNCTTPDPLSDNLFKPRERYISGREMQLRSRRIYNKLPEVTKKKEEEKKRTISQTNRLRVEVFKKRLLDQILQR